MTRGERGERGRERRSAPHCRKQRGGTLPVTKRWRTISCRDCLASRMPGWPRDEHPHVSGKQSAPDSRDARTWTIVFHEGARPDARFSRTAQSPAFGPAGLQGTANAAGALLV